MAQADGTTHDRVRTVLIVVCAVLAVALVTIVFLVLTGIIAEPETVIEGIVRALLGQ